MDVANAFLNGDLDEMVYMKLPHGYQEFRSRITTNKGQCPPHLGCNKVGKLKKILYGLMQSPRKWFQKLSLTLISLGYTQSRQDHGLFIHTTHSTITLVLVYVDGIFICENQNFAICHLKTMMSKSFNMKDLGEIQYFLGLEIDRSEVSFFISKEVCT